MGLGNPGPRYAGTRHNAGWEVVERLSRRWGISLSERCCRSRSGTGSVEGQGIRLVQPETFMNDSGEAVRCLAERFSAPPEGFLIILDDAALPLGTVRVRGDGSAGGHNGLQSVLDALATDRIPRLRVGVAGDAPLPADLTDFVLGPFRPEEADAVEAGLARAEAAAVCWAAEGLEQAMNRFNG